MRKFKTKDGFIGHLVEENEAKVKLKLPSDEMMPPKYGWFEKSEVEEIKADEKPTDKTVRNPAPKKEAKKEDPKKTVKKSVKK